jgi:hypothetical protein
MPKAPLRLAGDTESSSLCLQRQREAHYTFGLSTNAKTLRVREDTIFFPRVAILFPSFPGKQERSGPQTLPGCQVQ